MSYNDRYWIDKQNRAKKAQEHTALMEERYHEEIAKCISMSKIYDGGGEVFKEADNMPKIEVWNTDSVSALYEADMNKGFTGDFCVLNFASYKNPGGMFIQGSKAQEECLCHDSFLYNVLKKFDGTYYEWNRKHLNRALYENRALYTPGVIFDADGKKGIVKADVLTCAAPNFTTYNKYGSGIYREKKAVNSEALYKRIRYIRYVIEHYSDVNTLILGAYGCGVFGQDPEEVALMFKDTFKNSPFDQIVFAIPKGMDEKNYRAFDEVFR